MSSKLLKKIALVCLLYNGIIIYPAARQNADDVITVQALQQGHRLIPAQ